MLCGRNGNVVMWSNTARHNAAYSEPSLRPSAFFSLSSLSLTIALYLPLTSIKWAHLAVDVMVGIVRDILDHHCTVLSIINFPGVTTGDRDRVVLEDTAIVFVALYSTTLELVWEEEEEGGIEVRGKRGRGRDKERLRREEDMRGGDGGEREREIGEEGGGVRYDRGRGRDNREEGRRGESKDKEEKEVIWGRMERWKWLMRVRKKKSRRYRAAVYASQ